MQQMPKEGRFFCMVDNNWKQVMAKAVVSVAVEFMSLICFFALFY